MIAPSMATTTTDTTEGLAMRAIIEERGNGIAGVGEYVTEDGQVYRVTAIHGPIHAGHAAGAPSYVHATVEAADWDDIDDDSEPYCTAVVEEDA
jgi:hypothetical protein